MVAKKKIAKVTRKTTKATPAKLTKKKSPAKKIAKK